MGKALPKGSRKSMATVVQFLDKVTKDRDENQVKLIELAKRIRPYGNSINWDDNVWNVTDAFAGAIRSSEVRKNKNLHFLRLTPNEKESLGKISDIVKALSCLRFNKGNQGAANQKQFIDGWRYIYEVLLTKPNQSIDAIAPHDLELACILASKRLSQGTAYNLHKSIHEIADLLDANRLTRVPLTFRYKKAKRPDSTSGIHHSRVNDNEHLQETQNTKMAGEDVLQAIGKLYQLIPTEDERQRVCILVITLLVCTGRRIGEILTLPAKPVQLTDNGVAYLEYYPQKRSTGNLSVVRDRLYLIPSTTELIKSCVDELLEITKKARDSAEYIYKNKLPDLRCIASVADINYTTQSIADLTGCTKAVIKRWVRESKCQTEARTNNGFELNKNAWIKVIESNNPVVLRPCLVVADGANLHFKDLLLVFHKYQLENGRGTIPLTVSTLSQLTITDALKGRTTQKAKMQSLFEQYLGNDELATNTHSFRHTLNTLLDEGGLSELLQTRWFGRKNPTDTRSYQHTSPAKRAIEISELIKKGKVAGKVPDTVKVLPASVGEAYLKARLKAVHDVGTGFCFRSFSQSPCPKHLECTANCGDYGWIKDDETRKDEVKRQYAITKVNQEKAIEQSQKGRGASQDWVEHNKKKINTLEKQLDDLGVAKFDPNEYLDGLNE